MLTYFKTEYKRDPVDKHKHHVKVYYLDEFGGVHIRSLVHSDDELFGWARYFVPRQDTI